MTDKQTTLEPGAEAPATTVVEQNSPEPINTEATPAASDKTRTELLAEQRTRTDENMAKIMAGRKADASELPTELEPKPGDEPEKGEENLLDSASTENQDSSEHPAQAEPTALDLARTALTRDGLKPELLEGIAEETLIAMGKATAARQAEQKSETQRIVEERNALAARLEESAPKPEGSPDPEAKGHPDTDKDKQRESLQRVFSDEEADAIVEAFGPIVGDVQEARAQATAAQERAKKAAVEAEVYRARQEVVKSHPDLSQDAEWGKVVLEADKLLKIPGRFDGNADPVLEAFREAAVNLGHKKPAPVQSSPDGPTAPNKGTTRDFSKLTQTQRIAEFLRLRHAGVSQEEIARRYGR